VATATVEHRLWSLPATGSVARSARHAAVGFLRDAGVAPDVVAVAELLTSELVSNAAGHAGAARVAVCAEVDAEGVRIGVRDLAPDAVVACLPPSPERIGGRGLFLVDRLARRWGIDRGDRTKTVWFELPRSA